MGTGFFNGLDVESQHQQNRLYDSCFVETYHPNGKDHGTEKSLKPSRKVEQSRHYKTGNKKFNIHRESTGVVSRITMD